jgi:hypothetical protein
MADRRHPLIRAFAEIPQEFIRRSPLVCPRFLADECPPEFAVFGPSQWNNENKWAEYKTWLLKPMTLGVFSVKIGDRGLVLQNGEKIN